MLPKEVEQNQNRGSRRKERKKRIEITNLKTETIENVNETELIF
jgi:hypothetical protein